MLECDYLVVGTGAAGMAFADAVVSESPDRTLIMIDKLPEPGGHWNQAYDFCKLHQPAKWYGVASEKLERPNNDKKNKNSDSDLSSKQEILDYYRLVLDKLIRTGRVKHFGECTYQYDDDDAVKDNNETTTMEPSNAKQKPSFVLHSFTDKEGISQMVKVKRRLVDATYQKIRVPSTRKPSYEVHPDVDFIPINGLSDMAGNANGNDIASTTANNKTFVVVGSGKTGIDAILYLLNDLGVPPDHITWIMPRDAWLFDRSFWAPETVLLRIPLWLNYCETLEESLLQQETNGVTYRLDPNIWPTKFSCATVAKNELQQLRKIKNIVRKGRVTSITPTHLVMTNNNIKVPYPAGSIVVDCSANGLPPREAVPIFEPHKIVLQPVGLCVICLGAASTGYIECHPQFFDDQDRNTALMPNPYPSTVEQGLFGELMEFRNQMAGIGFDPRTQHWHSNCRLKYDAHSNAWTMVQLMAGKIYFMMKSIPIALDAKKIQYQKLHNKEFPHTVYDPASLAKTMQQIGIMLVFFWTIVVGGLVLLGFLGFKASQVLS